MNRREFTKAVIGASAASLMPSLLAASKTGAVKAPWAAAFKGVSADLPAMDMKVRGALPLECQGTLFRNGPALFERAGQRYTHWFDPDGMIQAFTMTDKAISHRGRFVRTEKYIAEENAQRFLFNGAGSILEGSMPARNNDSINVANTNVQPFGDELLALWEGGSAYRVSPNTLDTMGKQQWSKELSGVPFSAHPRLDDKGEMWNIGSLPMPNFASLVLYHIDSKGNLKNSKVHRLDFGGYQHDFILTPNYLIALNSSAVAHHGESFVSMFQWESERPSQLLVFDKRDLSLLKTIEVPPAFVFHFGNGWERGGKVVFTASQYANAAFMQHGMSRLAQQLNGPYEDETRLLRYEIDLVEGRAKIDDLGTNLEFPSFDRRFPFHSQLVLGVSDNRARQSTIQSVITTVDPESSEKHHFDYGSDFIVEEPQFIPILNGDVGRGYVLHSYLNYRTERTGLAILRSEAIEDGPIMTAEMDRCLPLGFHGCFIAS